METVLCLHHFIETVKGHRRKFQLSEESLHSKTLLSRLGGSSSRKAPPTVEWSVVSSTNGEVGSDEALKINLLKS